MLAHVIAVRMLVPVLELVVIVLVAERTHTRPVDYLDPVPPLQGPSPGTAYDYPDPLYNPQDHPYLLNHPFVVDYPCLEG